MKTIIGIDPGLNGAAAALGGINGKWAVLDCLDLPTRPDGSKREIDITSVRAWMLRFRVHGAVIENVQAMPGGAERRTMGAASAFRFGMACGQLRGAMEAWGIPIHLIHPAVWKRHFGLSGKKKDADVKAAERRLLGSSPFLTLKKHHQRADAMLIGLAAIERENW